MIWIYEEKNDLDQYVYKYTKPNMSGLALSLHAQITGKFLSILGQMNQNQKEAYIMKDFVPAYIN